MIKRKILVCFVAAALMGCGMLNAQIKTGKADLQFKSLILTKNRIQQGGDFTLRFSMVKVGDPTPRFGVNIYLARSYHPKFLQASNRIKSIPVSAMGQGKIPFNKSHTHKIPPLLKPGRYYVVAVIDGANRVKELNEKNNSGHVELTVLPYTPTFDMDRKIPKPDVKLDMFTVNNSAPDGIPVTIYFKNNGPVNIKNLGYKVAVYKLRYGRDWTWIRETKSTYPGMVPIGDARYTITTTIPAGDLWGYRVKLCVTLDPDDKLKESDERNNAKCNTYEFRSRE